MRSSNSTVPEAKLALYSKLVEAFPQIERKGASMPYTSLNGHMFSFLKPNGEMSIRLPEGALETFKKKFKTRQTVQHGREMKEYADVPDKLLERTSELKKHFAMSIEYVATLKPKPTKRKKR